jgi:hypothetical protein
MKMLDSMVLALAVPAYKGLVETTEKLKAPMEKTFEEKKDDIYDVQRKITEQLAGTSAVYFDRGKYERANSISMSNSSLVNGCMKSPLIFIYLKKC